MEGYEVGTLLRSIDDCISVLQGDLHQPGTPAVVLKLASSWHKVKSFLTPKSHEQSYSDNNIVAMVNDEENSSYTCSLQTVNFEQEEHQALNSEQNRMEQIFFAGDKLDCLSLEGATGIDSAVNNTSNERFEQTDFYSEAVPLSENEKELSTELPTVTSPGLLILSPVLTVENYLLFFLPLFFSLSVLSSPTSQHSTQF